jgi:hypothetical protein
VSSLLDQFSGWQFLALLVPLMVVMLVIRRRDEKATSISWADLDQLQKAWLFLTLLRPGLVAKLLSLLSPEERDRLISAGKQLKGSPRQAALPVLAEFFKQSSGQLGGLPGKEVEEISRWLNLRFEDEPEEFVGLYRKVYM